MQRQPDGYVVTEYRVYTVVPVWKVRRRFPVWWQTLVGACVAGGFVVLLAALGG